MDRQAAGGNYGYYWHGYYWHGYYWHGYYWHGYYWHGYYWHGYYWHLRGRFRAASGNLRFEFLASTDIVRSGSRMGGRNVRDPRA